MGDGGDGAAFFVTVGMFSASFGALLSQGIDWVASMTSAAVLGFVSGTATYLAKTQIDRRGARREAHRRFVYDNALLPAFREVQTHEIPGLARVTGELVNRNSGLIFAPIYPQFPSTNSWQWLLRHESEIDEAHRDFVQSRDQLQSMVERKANEIGAEAAPKHWQHLESRPLWQSINRRRFGLGLLTHAAAQGLSFWTISHHNHGATPAATLMFENRDVAQGPADTIEALTSPANVQACTSAHLQELTAAWEQLHLAHQNLLLLLEKKAATGTVAGKCSECP